MSNDAKVRAALRGAILPHVPPECVDEVTDLSMHAVREAKHTLIRISDGASTGQIKVCTIGISVSMMIHELQDLQQQLLSEVQSQGITPAEVQVQA